jgi:hypothetical protein
MCSVSVCRAIVCVMYVLPQRTQLLYAFCLLCFSLSSHCRRSVCSASAYPAIISVLSALFQFTQPLSVFCLFCLSVPSYYLRSVCSASVYPAIVCILYVLPQCIQLLSALCLFCLCVPSHCLFVCALFQRAKLLPVFSCALFLAYQDIVCLLSVCFSVPSYSLPFSVTCYCLHGVLYFSVLTSCLPSVCYALQSYCVSRQANSGFLPPFPAYHVHLTFLLMRPSPPHILPVCP